jgi:hypothetical protein
MKAKTTIDYAVQVRGFFSGQWMGHETFRTERAARRFAKAIDLREANRGVRILKVTTIEEKIE